MNLSRTSIERCIVHRVGNKNRDEDLRLSKSALNFSDDVEIELKKYFLNPFKGIWNANRFRHEISMTMNEVFVCADKIMKEDAFVENSINIAKHLYDSTRHPGIKFGELFIVLLNDVEMDGVTSNAVGIFKSEAKDTFFNINDKADYFQVNLNKGISPSKLDKGCIVFNDDYNDGYKVFTFERNGADTEYWQNDFLSVEPKADDYHSTESVMNVCKDFVVNKLPTEFEISRADQINLLNTSLSYFKGNEEFNMDNFSEEVLANEEVISSFHAYREEVQPEKPIETESFTISPKAVNKGAKVYKSVLKLDKNFHIYIHGDHDLIEKGFDEERKMKYYKVYFEEES
ncbi:MAG: nucleoid-associated protein [Flavobacteriales bacterium]|nr:nucleoid-associated protein [Flavobacteriales bacterium]